MYEPSPSQTFDLIKTLEPTEKAYIKKQFSANEKNLKLLFDDLNKTKLYNKNLFKKKYKHRSYFTHLSQNKTYLRKKIIDALVHYNGKNIPKINRRNQLNTISILIHKGLLKQAVKLIEQGLEENEKLEHFLQCYELCSLLTNLSVNNVTYTLTSEILSSFKKRRRFYIRQLSLIEKYAEFADIHYSKISNQQKIDALQQKFNEMDLINAEDLPDDYPFYTKRMFYFSKNEQARLQNNSRSTIHFLKKNIDLYFEYPYFLKKDYTPFLTDSVNFLDNLQSNNLFDQFFDEYKKITDMIEKSTKYFFFQIACTNSKQYQKAFVFSKEYRQFLEDQKNLSDRFIAASKVAIAVASLNVQRFEEAIDTINLIQSTKLYQYQYELRLIQIIAHYRLGNDLVLDSLFTSFIYYLKKQEKSDQTKAIRKLKKCIETQNFNGLKDVKFDELLSLNVQFALATTISAN